MKLVSIIDGIGENVVHRFDHNHPGGIQRVFDVVNKNINDLVRFVFLVSGHDS